MTPMIRALEVATEGDRFLRLKRDFAAPRALVWRAHTEPEIVKRWLWARDVPMITCDMDFRVGGSLRWVWAAPHGEMGMSGRYVEIVPTERIVHTELFDDDWTEGETLVTTRFEDHGSFCRMDMLVAYSSGSARAGALRTPMTDGMEECYQRLDEMLAKGSLR